MAAFAASFSIEATRPSEAEIVKLAAVLAPNTAVYLSAVPAMAPAELIGLAASLRRVGLDPVAHIAARRFASVAQLQELLQALRSQADMRQVLVIGGDVEASGPFPDALSVIQKANLRSLGFEDIGIAAYPEGHASIPAGRLEAALDEKIATATAQGLRVHIVSQFSFAPDQVLAWLRRLRASGIAVPVKVGMAGPTSVPALLRYAKRCGVAASLRGLASGVGLVGHVGPGRMIEVLSAAGSLGDATPHYFSFGGVVETARFACDAARGTPSFSHAMAQPNNA
jgi:methylenetetrahydrofolate reductase (NADPH)